MAHQLSFQPITCSCGTRIDVNAQLLGKGLDSISVGHVVSCPTCAATHAVTADKAELFLADTGAWHHFGIPVQGAQSATEAMAIACPWEALKLALFAHAPCGSPQEALQTLWGSKFFRTEQYGIFRSDTGNLIGTVGAAYEVVQPTFQFDFVDTLLEGTGYHYESAGAVKGGSVVFVCARVGQFDVLNSGDVSRTYLAFVNSFDGSLAAQCYLTATRIVCMNTVQMSLGNAQSVLKFKHTKNVHSKLTQAQALVEQVTQTEESLKTKLDTLAQRKIVKKEKYTQILDSIFGASDATRTENIKKEITQLWDSNDGNAFPDFKQTAYALWNAVTNYTDHHRATRGDDKQSSRYESAILGGGAKLKAKALERILVLTDGSEEHTFPSAAIPDSVDQFLAELDNT